MSSESPVLAIMGHPNAGKSSVVATLTENDRIDIDKRAGTTTVSDAYPVIIDGRTIMEFIDTPGFQNPTDILEWFQANQSETDLAGAFVTAHRDDPMFSHDRARRIARLVQRKTKPTHLAFHSIDVTPFPQLRFRAQRIDFPLEFFYPPAPNAATAPRAALETTHPAPPDPVPRCSARRRAVIPD